MFWNRLQQRFVAGAVGMVLLAALAAQPLIADQDKPWEGSWKAWPADYPSFELSNEELLEQWDRLHLRDSLPKPDSAYVTLMAGGPVEDAEAVAERLQEGWRHFHAGNFQQAYEIGMELGDPGYFLAGRAWMTYAVHMVEDKQQRLAMLEEGVKRMNAAIFADGRPVQYWERAGMAMLYGQYSKEISTTRAASERVPVRVRELLDEALKESDEQPAALGVYGGYHTEVVDRIGGMLARVTYGARADSAREYFERTLTLDPDLVQARVEFAESLLRLYGERYAAEAHEQLQLAQAIEPQDAEDYLEQLRAERVLMTWNEQLSAAR